MPLFPEIHSVGISKSQANPFPYLVRLQEKRRISSHHRCEFYEAEERGYFRFQSTADTNKTVSFFKGSGKPYMEHQARASHKPKGRKCEEFVKVPAAPPQPKFNFPFEPIKPRPTPSTTTTTTTTSTTTTTTTPRPTTTSPAPRTTVTARATHRHRHQGHHHQQRQKELGTQEFSSATDTRLIRHQSHHNKQLQPQSPPSRRRKTKKQPPKRGQGQKNKQQQLQKVPSTSPRSRNGGLARKKPVEPRLRDYSDFMFLDAEALDQERKRAFALESEKALLRKEQRMADFGLTEDYWNDDNMIGSHEDAKWVAKRPPPPPPPGGKKKPSDSILISRLMGKGAGSGEAKSLFRPKSLGQKRVTALGSKEAGSSTTGISGKKRASMSPERLQNHHHHPSMSRRRS